MTDEKVSAGNAQYNKGSGHGNGYESGTRPTPRSIMHLHKFDKNFIGVESAKALLLPCLNKF